MSFRFEIAADVWSKSDASDRERRIGGVCTTDDLDRQSEVLLQDGLDFEPFLKSGWFNDNHDQGMDAILGYPTHAELRKAANRNGWYVEGYLLKGAARADAVWMLANALQKTDRKLGFSVEGSIQARDEANPGIVRKAIVRNVAITHCPVNTATTLSVLAKSLAAGPAVPVPAGAPQTGENGRLLSPQSLEAKVSNAAARLRKRRKLTDVEERALSKAERNEPLTRREAADLVRLLAPGLSLKQAEEIVDFDIRRRAG